MKERVIKNKITTLLGLVIIIITIILWLLGTIDASILPIPVLLGLGLFWSKDGILKKVQQSQITENEQRL